MTPKRDRHPHGGNLGQVGAGVQQRAGEAGELPVQSRSVGLKPCDRHALIGKRRMWPHH